MREKKLLSDADVEAELQNFDPKKVYARQAARRRAYFENPRNAAKVAANETRMNLCIALYTLRKEAKLSQAQLAKRLKIAQTNIAELESGRQNATVDTLAKIADACGKKFMPIFV